MEVPSDLAPEVLEPAKVWLAMAGMAAAAFFFRAAFFMVHERVRLAPWIMQALEYVPPAVMAALVLPELITFGPEAVFPDVRLLAGAVAFAAAWFSRNLLLTIAAGMAALWGFAALGL
jgi:branched-subunit amino acid transport protein